MIIRQYGRIIHRADGTIEITGFMLDGEGKPCDLGNLAQEIIEMCTGRPDVHVYEGDD